jgi:hypothetical protein
VAEENQMPEQKVGAHAVRPDAAVVPPASTLLSNIPEIQPSPHQAAAQLVDELLATPAATTPAATSSPTASSTPSTAMGLASTATGVASTATAPASPASSTGAASTAPATTSPALRQRLLQRHQHLRLRRALQLLSRPPRGKGRLPAPHRQANRSSSSIA